MLFQVQYYRLYEDMNTLLALKEKILSGGKNRLGGEMPEIVKVQGYQKIKTKDNTDLFSDKCVLCDYLSLSVTVIYESSKDIIQKFQMFSLSPKGCLACSTHQGFSNCILPKS